MAFLRCSPIKSSAEWLQSGSQRPNLLAAQSFDACRTTPASRAHALVSDPWHILSGYDLEFAGMSPLQGARNSGRAVMRTSNGARAPRRVVRGRSISAKARLGLGDHFGAFCVG